jgi:hypothetical protein
MTAIVTPPQLAPEGVSLGVEATSGGVCWTAPNCLFADHSADHSASPPSIASAGGTAVSRPCLGAAWAPRVTACWVLGPTFRSFRACCLTSFAKKQCGGSSMPTAHGLGKNFVRLTLSDPASCAFPVPHPPVAHGTSPSEEIAAVTWAGTSMTTEHKM